MFLSPTIRLFRFTFIFVPMALLAEPSSPSKVDELVRIDPTPLDRDQSEFVVSYAAALRTARPSVVSVYAESLRDQSVDQESLLEQLFGNAPEVEALPRLGIGSGVIVSKNGYIITNEHVISRADEIRVQLDDLRVFEATLVGADPRTDIAVLKIDEDDLPHATLADSDLLEVGDVVFAIGNPLGVGKTVTMGIVSALKRQQMGVIQGGFESFIQTDAPINTGNSGGALVDAYGRVVGINTLIQTDGLSGGSIGIGFAVPANLAYSVMTDLIEVGSVMRGFLGVGIEPLSELQADLIGVESLKGALVNQVNRGTPAEAAGIEVGDLIVSVDGAEILSPSDLRVTIAQKKPGDEVSVIVIRDGERLSLLARLVQRDGEIASREEPRAPRIETVEPEVPVELEGVSLGELDDEARKRFDLDEHLEGVVVFSVDPNSPFAEALPEGMVIQKVNGRKVATPEDVSFALKRDGKNSLLVAYLGVYRWIGVEVSEGQ
ncbi:trypsin-like peptidase domain-containing protein [Pelagicoccus sp. SDUM812003]|uniref:trypsin-like peptidase domain-containing protein n=1 Tax=Pelagicoccus sp. SDUM812003 TaxID=3041267 RepID=UPI00280E56E7|nr:trypsin-like peptidase domain-containing protein [Pelagicoccus sp. SDUM812003]MDQ8203662.1 trypsin-like peptidase domain-containing protein [Pelagicoccus sp. SDUM812003]